MSKKVIELEGLNHGEHVELHPLGSNHKGQTWWVGQVMLDWANVKDIYFHLPQNELPTRKHIVEFERMILKTRMQALDKLQV